jgi:glutaredoxin
VRHILGQELLAREAERKPVRRCPVPPVQLVERFSLPLREAAMELQIVEIGVGHAAVVTGRKPGTIRGVQVTLYSRPGCHLCDVAREVIEAERERTSFELEEVDVSTEDALELEYGIRIPVVLIDGVEAFEIEVDAGRFRGLVAG